MAAEFYRKSRALYEEFKRRELHYSSVEMSTNNSYYTKNNTNSSLQDYLEKLSKREKETEKSFKDLLNHLEDMGKSTDQMSLKLEKLYALRNAAISSTNTPWPAIDNTFNRSFMSYEGNSFQERNTTSFPHLFDYSTFHKNPTSGYSLPKVDCRSESTQTEHVFCEKCHYPFTRNMASSISSTVSIPINQNKSIVTEHAINNPLIINPNRNIYDEIGQIMKSSIHNTEQINQHETINKQYVSNYPLSLKSNQDIYKESETGNPKEMFNLGHTSTELLQSPTQTLTSFKNTIAHVDPVAELDSNQNSNFNNTPQVPLVTGNLVAGTKNPRKDSMQNTNLNNTRSLIDSASFSLDTEISSKAKQITTQQDKIIDSSVIQNSVCDAKDTESSAKEDNTLAKSEMFEKAASKSDDESINHEFDFLESDRRPSMKSKIIEPENISSENNIHLPENSSPDNRNESGSLENNLVGSHNPNVKNSDPPTSKNQKSTESFLTTNDAKMESSLSEGIPSPVHHSADASNHSESDSLSETDTPFTASAAYQALLGNVATTKTKQKVPSFTESESEDEIENAYAMATTATRKSSNINFDAILQIQKKQERKESASEVILKNEKKVSKPSSVGNTQNKLSKNTRKVLGLDTSSGSEVELEAKPSVTKIDEDSDEFDFYN